jgi:hypothetical protein
MPIFEVTDRFKKDYAGLDLADRQRFERVVREQFVADLDSGHGLRPGLRVRGVQGARGVYEMTWAPDGRATWQYDPERSPGMQHIIWRRIGTHDVFRTP